MYTISKGPSKLVTQRRTGPSQQIDNKVNDFKHKQTSWNILDLPAPKIVFNRLNGRKYHQPPAAPEKHQQQQEAFTPAHEENVKFVCEAWQDVEQTTVHYEDDTTGPNNFQPIDLDEWWAKRFLANIDKLS